MDVVSDYLSQIWELSGYKFGLLSDLLLVFARVSLLCKAHEFLMHLSSFNFFLDLKSWINQFIFWLKIWQDIETANFFIKYNFLFKISFTIFAA